MKDALNSERHRRIVRYARRTQHGDAKVTPQWHQWLRHTRPDPPTLQEQASDITRQAQLKHNAALADARWAAKAKYIEKPQPQADRAPGRLPSSEQGRPRPEEQKPDNQKTAVNPGADYQPEAWVPGSSR
jgi:NADH dehydrogenase [ubiquinone] 1 alpha subcomplex assembly factor 2